MHAEFFGLWPFAVETIENRAEFGFSGMPGPLSSMVMLI